VFLLQDKIKVSKQVQRTREWVFEAFIILLETRPYEDITISDLTKKAGVARQTFYRNYLNKEQVVTTYFDDFFQHILANTPRAESKANVIKRHLEALLQNQRILRILIKSGLKYLLLEQIQEHSQAIWGALDNNKSLDMLAYQGFRFQMSGIWQIMMDWIYQENPLPIDEMALAVAKLTEPYNQLHCNIFDLMNCYRETLEEE
jgi:AcrR family transcriptional regulator